MAGVVQAVLVGARGATDQVAAALPKSVDQAAVEVFHAANAADVGMIDPEERVVVFLCDPIAAQHIQDFNQMAPVVCVTENDAERVSRIREGATEVIEFSSINSELLETVVRLALCIHAVRQEHRHTRFKLESAEARLVAALECNPDGVVIVDDNGMVRAANECAQKLLGEEGQVFVGSTFIIPPLVNGGAELEIKRADGTVSIIELRSASISWDDRPAKLLACRDLTERRARDEQTVQSKKMEAVGRLAGGVAHEFNNLLTAITGYSDLLLSQLGSENALCRDVYEIKNAATRAGSITRQLITFSRRNPFRPNVFDLRGVVRGIEPTLRRMIGENIELLTELPDEAAYVKAEVNQIEQIIINLAVNAREAMPSGGRLYVTVESRASTSMNQASLAEPDTWIQMTVRDTGWGINSSVLPRIFEPFFTTKGPDEGPGLGLAIVYSLVRQCGGEIIAESQSGVGTAFRILWPRAATPAPATGSAEPQPGSRRTILLVEDQDLVRSVTRRLLEAAGFQVIDAADAENALNVVQDQLKTLDLLLTDVVMPEMSGVELAQQVAIRRPELPVLYMSGFTRDEVLHDPRNNRPAQFLQKPFSRDQLIAGVREALASPVK